VGRGASSAKAACRVAFAALLAAGCAPKPKGPPPEPPDYARAIPLVESGEPEEAAEELARQLARDPAPPGEARFALALVLARLGRRGESTACAEAALRDLQGAPAAPVVCYLLFLNALGAGEAGAARAALDRAARLAEAWGAALGQGEPAEAARRRQALAQMALGRRALLAGNAVRATGRYSGAREHCPASPHLTLCLSECLRRIGDLEASARLLHECVRELVAHPQWAAPVAAAWQAAYPRLASPRPRSATE
jgi:predicted Zn-dependent protease